MALPSSGSISMAQVRSELGESGSISLGQSSVRNLAGVNSGAISMSDLRGKSSWESPFYDGQTYSAGSIEPTAAYVKVSVLGTGEVVIFDQNGNEFGRAVVIPDGLTSIEVRCVQNSGVGALGNSLINWVTLDFTSNLAGQLTFTSSNAGTYTGVFTLEFRDRRTGIDGGNSGTFTLELNVNSGPGSLS